MSYLNSPATEKSLSHAFEKNSFEEEADCYGVNARNVRPASRTSNLPSFDEKYRHKKQKRNDHRQQSIAGV